MGIARIRQAVLERAIVSEQHETLAVTIQTSDGVHAANRDTVSERGSFARELAQHTIGLVEQQVLQCCP